VVFMRQLDGMQRNDTAASELARQPREAPIANGFLLKASWGSSKAARLTAAAQSGPLIPIHSISQAPSLWPIVHWALTTS